MSRDHGKKLKDIRIAEGMTQRGFSEALGIGLGTIKNYETDQREVGLAVLDKVVNHPAFRKYTLWLMTGESTPGTGQISPVLSPDGQEDTSSHQNDQKVG